MQTNLHKYFVTRHDFECWRNPIPITFWIHCIINILKQENILTKTISYTKKLSIRTLIAENPPTHMFQGIDYRKKSNTSCTFCHFWFYQQLNACNPIDDFFIDLPFYRLNKSIEIFLQDIKPIVQEGLQLEYRQRFVLNAISDNFNLSVVQNQEQNQWFCCRGVIFSK